MSGILSFRHRVPVTGVAIGAALLVAGSVASLFWRTQKPQPVPQRTETTREEAPLSVEMQVARRRLRVVEGEPLDVFTPPTVALDGFVAPRRLAPPWSAINSTLFDSDDTRVLLANVRGIPRDAICQDAEGRRFACGLMGRAALHNTLAKKDVVCRQVFGKRPRSEPQMTAECTADGLDLAEHLVRSGFAVPDQPAAPRFLAALEEAREERRGIWAGTPPAMAADPAIVDGQAHPFGSLRPIGLFDAGRSGN